jgi:tetratricopeptide (TPR) repeat protein
MNKLFFILIVSALSLMNANAQNLNGKKLLKSVQKLEQAKQYKAGIDLIHLNITNAGKLENKVALKLVELQVKSMLLDSAKIYLSEIENVKEPKNIEKSKELEAEIVALKHKYKTEVTSGYLYLQKREFDRAKQAFQSALKYDTGNYEVWFRKGEQEHYTGSVEQAEMLYQKALTKYKDDEKEQAHVYVHLAEVYIIQRKFYEATQICDSALKINKKEDEAIFIKGQAQYFQRDFARASINFSKFLKSNPKSISSYNMRGNCYLEMERYSSAILNFTETIRLDSNMYDAYGNRGKCHFYLKQYDLAEKDYKKLTESYDGNYNALNALGICAYKQANYKSAVHYFEQVTTISSQEAYKFNLAMAYYKNDQLKLALRYFNELAESRRNQPNYNVGHTRVLMALKQYEKARVWLDASIKLTPHVREYYELSADLYLKVGAKDKVAKEEKIAHNISGDALSFDPVF